MKDLAAPVFRSIESQNTLLITDGFEDKRFVMIDRLETKRKTIKFGINEADILNQGLEVLPEMVLLGGISASTPGMPCRRAGPSLWGPVSWTAGRWR